jgi:membrane fusion protein (multidrug efflux system)
MPYRFFVFFLLIIFSEACKKNSATPATAARVSYSTTVEGYVVKPLSLSDKVTVSGTLVPAEETELHAEATGRVVRINLPEGKMVRKGELLLKIFDEDLKARLSQLETKLRQAQITEQRLGDLLKVRGISQQEYDLALLEVKNLRTEMDLVRIDVSKTELRAPYDGLIGLRRISPGAYVTPATPIVTIRAASALKLDFSVPEKYSAGIRSGQQVAFMVQGSTKAYRAVVQASEQRINEDSRNLLVRALVQGSSQDLLPGTFAEVDLVLDQKNNALLVPSQAIIPQARDKKVIVCRNGKATFTTVKTGIRQADSIEIIDGLQIGDTIAITGVLFLRPDAAMVFSKVQ